MIKTMIFDFDGTLADSLAVLIETYNEIAPRYRCKTLVREDIERLRHGKVQDAFREVGITPFTLPFILLAVKRNVSKRMALVKWHPQMKEVLLQLKKRGMTLGILTSNSQENVRLFFEATDTQDLFSFSYSIRGLSGKKAALNRILKKHHLSPQEVAYIGDEIRDIEAAKGVGVVSVGMTSGFQTGSILSSASPDYIFDSPEELFTLCNHDAF